MAPLRALLVDDEALAVRRLARSLEQVPDVEVAGATTSAREALALIAAYPPDLLFLDISMPGLTGFELVERLPPAARPAIIFVTAYDAYAVQAFDVSAADYLMKPFAQPRLEEAVERGRLWLRAREAPAEAQTWPDALWVHRHRSFVRVPVEEIDWIEGHGDYARIHGHEFVGLARTTLTALEEKLDPARFIRTHRSAICRKGAIVRLQRKPSGAMIVLLANGDEAPVGRTFVAGLRALLRLMER
jgi:two-component system response regulator AlgR